MKNAIILFLSFTSMKTYAQRQQLNAGVSAHLKSVFSSMKVLDTLGGSVILKTIDGG